MLRVMKTHTSMFLLPLFPAVLLAQTPASFHWVAETENWDASSAWSVSANADHTIPGVAGDKTYFGPNATVTLTQDVTVGTLSTTNQTSLLSDGTVRTLTLDSGVEGTPATVTFWVWAWNQPNDSYFGSGFTDNNLVLSLASPLNLNGYGNGSGSSRLRIASKLSGGSAAAPCDITYKWIGSWGSGSVFLCNPANDFRGDIHIQGTSTRDGDLVTIFAGLESVIFDDGLLGDPANEIYLEAKSEALAGNIVLDLSRASSSTPLNRIVHGTGTVKGLNQYVTWNQEGSVYLGPSCVIDPGLSTSEVGFIDLVGAYVRMQEGTTFRMTLGDGVNDKVRFSSSTGDVKFTGAIEFDTADGVSDIPGGTSFDLFTVSKVPFTFTPSSTPAGYSFSVAGSAVAGWTVTATKAASNAMASSLDASLIGDTFATANANVLMPAGGSVATTLRVYYGTTDGGDNPAAWDAYADVPGTITEDSLVSIVLTGLTLDGTYVYRFAATSDGTTVFSQDSATFTTRALGVANTFTWLATNDLWSTEGNWYVPTPHARLIPGYPGDKLIFELNGPSDRRIYLTSSASYGDTELHLTGGQYGTHARFYAYSTPETVTITLDPGSMGTTNRFFGTGNHSGVSFGSTVASNTLAVALTAPVLVSCDNNHGGINIHFSCPVSGGTAENPLPFAVVNTGNEWRSAGLYFDSEANTFVGDLYVGATTVVKGPSYLFIGDDDCHTDAVLGDPANRVILRNLSTANYTGNWRNRTAVCNRTFLGNGTIRSGQRVTGTLSDSQYYPLSLSSTARFAPCGIDGTGFGTITFDAKALSSDPETLFEFDLAADGSANDSIAVTTTVSSPVVLNGRVVVTADRARVPAGNSWTLATIPASAGDFTCNWAAPAGNYLLQTTGNATDGWAVVLTKTQDATLLIVR